MENFSKIEFEEEQKQAIFNFGNKLLKREDSPDTLSRPGRASILKSRMESEVSSPASGRRSSIFSRGFLLSQERPLA